MGVLISVRSVAWIAINAVALAGCAVLLPFTAADIGTAISLEEDLVGDGAFLTRAKGFPPGHDHTGNPPVALEFVIASSDAEAAWQRARRWIELHAPQGIRTSTETVLETNEAPPTEVTHTLRADGETSKSLSMAGRPAARFRYTVTRASASGDGVRFVVTCAPGEFAGLVGTNIDPLVRKLNAIVAPLADRNAHTLAWFMKSGEMKPPQDHPKRIPKAATSG